MTFIEKLSVPGEHPVLLQGLSGQLEAIITVPEQISNNTVAFLGHPHSLQGGTMNNKVVTTLARAFKELGIPSLRFNFRGVGQSAGIYDEGIGESEDMIALVKSWKEEEPNLKIIFAGFSFGSYVAYRASVQFDPLLLITIAPPVHHYDYKEFSPQPFPWLIIQGNQDEVVPYSLVKNFAQEASPAIPLIEFEETGHFFHGTLGALKSQLINFIQAQVFSL